MKTLNKKTLWSKLGRAVAGVATATAMTTAMTGCHVVTTYSPAWYDVYGYYCGSGTPVAGCNFYADGSKIYITEDPYYSYGSTFYYGQWDFVNSYGYWDTYVGWGWQSADGILYDDYGYALNNTDEGASRDIIGDVASKETATVKRVGQEFATQNALAESTGIQIARTLNDWATLTKKQNRARTARDVADFSSKLYGVTADRAKDALNRSADGDGRALEGLNTEIARFWGTSPETSSTILKRWYKDQLENYDVN